MTHPTLPSPQQLVHVKHFHPLGWTSGPHTPIPWPRLPFSRRSLACAPSIIRLCEVCSTWQDVHHKKSLAHTFLILIMMKITFVLVPAPIHIWSTLLDITCNIYQLHYEAYFYAEYEEEKLITLIEFTSWWRKGEVVKYWCKFAMELPGWLYSSQLLIVWQENTCTFTCTCTFTLSLTLTVTFRCESTF